MSRNWLKRITLILSLILIIILIVPETTFAARYVALGDSISYGLTDLSGSGGFAGMYRTYLGVSDSDFNNLSVPGHTSQELLNVIINNEALIRNANIITISIGSNHLLGPAISSIVGLYGLNPGNYTDPDGKSMVRALARAVKADWTDGGPTPADRISWLMNPLRTEALTLNAAWIVGTAQFALNWPIIMLRIRLRAPLAKISVNNLYNPLLASKIAAPAFKTLYDTLGVYMSRINANITRYASLYRYRVINVAGPFANPVNYQYLTNPSADPFNAPLTFNIPAALLFSQNPGFDPENDLYFLPFFFACDPHPTTTGHYLIFKALAGLP